MDANTDPFRVKIVEEADFYANSHPYQVKIVGEGGSGVSKGYFYNGAFYKDAEHTELIEPKEGQIYYDLTGKKLYIYDGMEYRNIADTGDSDVVDIVNTYADLQNYDTTNLKDRDIIKVLVDETHDNKIAYYRWMKGSATWDFIGAQGPFYTKSETDELLEGKQDELTPGSGIIINNNTITYDPDVLSTVDYVDGSITATLTYVDQQDNNEHNGRVAGDNLINAKIGDLTELETTEKTELVGAINEVKGEIPELLTTTGQSTTAGMTQKAVTDALDTKASVTWRVW